MANRQRDCDCSPCDVPAQEKLYPVSKIGQILIFVGLALVFLSFVFGFWMAFLGAILVLIGYLVIQNC